MSKAASGKIGFWAVVAIGVGGMVGGGIFAVLGLAVQLAHGGTPVAFALAGVVALLTTYSYTKLSVAYPSRGGTVTFLDRVFGSGMLTGSLNVLLWLSYVVMLSLYAFAFGSYGATFLPQAWQGIGRHALISLSVITIGGLNLLSAELIGKAESWIVGLKVVILLFFVGAGMTGINTAQLAPGSWSPPLQLAAGGMIIFLAYEGFELIANTAQDVDDAARTLPRAYFTAVGFVIALYVLVADRHCRQPVGRQDRGRQGLRAGGSGSTVSRAGRLHADRNRGDAVHRLGDQCHALRRSAPELQHRARRRAAGDAGAQGVG